MHFPVNNNTIILRENSVLHPLFASNIFKQIGLWSFKSESHVIDIMYKFITRYIPAVAIVFWQEKSTYTLFLYLSNTFISKVRLKVAKNKQ